MNAILPLTDLMSGSYMLDLLPPLSTIVLQSEYVISKVDEGSWAIIDDGSTRPFRIENGGKISSRGYYAFLKKHFPPWCYTEAPFPMKYGFLYTR